MKKLLIRADDLGYSRAVNYGIYDSIKNGVVNNVGVMVNMPTTKMGLDLLKGQAIDYGLHTVISSGRPILPATEVPSLVDENGHFKASRVYRENYQGGKADFVKLEEVVAEIQAQYQRFVALVGRQPDYFEGHAVVSENFIKGLQIVAEKYDLPLLLLDMKKPVSFKKKTQFKFIFESMQADYQPLATVKRASLESEGEIIPMVVGHPGYLDQDILQNSSLTIPRIQEVASFTSPELKKWLQENEIKLVRYSDCD